MTVKLHSQTTVETRHNGTINIKVYFNQDSERYTLTYNLVGWNNNSWYKYNRSAKNLDTVMENFKREF